MDLGVEYLLNQTHEAGDTVLIMRPFCWDCHRPAISCFCRSVRSFTTSAAFALIVHPYEAKSTVGTAWILRRFIENLEWVRSNGIDLDSDPSLLRLLANQETVPLLLFPGTNALNLSRATPLEWRQMVPVVKRPLFFVVDGTWTQARAMLRRSALLRSLPRVSFDVTQLSEYRFKTQPSPSCLSSVEGVHRVIDVLADRGWGDHPNARSHDQMLEVFRGMVDFQIKQVGRGLPHSMNRSPR